jgi:hypothetical protein
MMFADRRKSARARFNRAGLVQHDRIGTRGCTIVNLSEGGARLCSDADLPGQFMLTLKTEMGETRKSCRVIWRLEQEFGVQFMD